MSSEERRKILQMVADGKISAEEAATLMRTLDEDSVEEQIEVIQPESGFGSEKTDAPEFEEVRRRALSTSPTVGLSSCILAASR